MGENLSQMLHLPPERDINATESVAGAPHRCLAGSRFASANIPWLSMRTSPPNCALVGSLNAKGTSASSKLTVQGRGYDWKRISVLRNCNELDRGGARKRSEFSGRLGMCYEKEFL